MGGRVRKSLLNARVNLIFYFLSLFFSFFSRKIFLDCLGADFIGLTGTLGNILGYLNLAELGVGAAISFFLYKPLQSYDRTKINEILSLFGYLYRKIGLFILLGGIVVSCFFPLVFGKTEWGLGIVYFSFFSFLGSSLIGYFINYRQILLSADQKNYLVAIYFQSAGLVKTALQIFLAYKYRDLYIWVGVEFIFGILGCIVLNRKIDKEYPWLSCNISQGKVLLKKYPDIWINTKQVFIHKIKDFLLSKSDELFIFIFVSLKMVAYYGNYVMITTKITLLFTSILDGANAGVGNLVAEGDRKKMMKVFWELMTIRHFIAGLLCFSIYYLLEPFVILWLGPEYVLDHTILVLMLVYIYIANSRGVVDMYNHSHGLYADTWAAWVELILNLGITVGMGYYYGIIGILLGKIVSVLLIVVLWKPYYLFTVGLKVPPVIYWKGAVRYFVIFIISFGFASCVKPYIPLHPAENYFSWIIFAFCIIFVYLVCNVFLFYYCAWGTKDCVKRLKWFKK